VLNYLVYGESALSSLLGPAARACLPQFMLQRTTTTPEGQLGATAVANIAASLAAFSMLGGAEPQQLPVPFQAPLSAPCPYLLNPGVQREIAAAMLEAAAATAAADPPSPPAPFQRAATTAAATDPVALCPADAMLLPPDFSELLSLVRPVAAPNPMVWARRQSSPLMGGAALAALEPSTPRCGAPGAAVNWFAAGLAEEGSAGAAAEESALLFSAADAAAERGGGRPSLPLAPSTPAGRIGLMHPSTICALPADHAAAMASFAAAADNVWFLSPPHAASSSGSSSSGGVASSTRCA
jgi:hypothetical protein